MAPTYNGHIVFLIKGLGFGGAERLVLFATRWLRAKDFAVTIANLNPRFQSLSPELSLAGAEIKNFNIFGRNGPMELFRLMRFLNRGDTTLIHAHLPLAGFVGSVLGFITGCPVVYTEHNVIEAYNPITRCLNRLTYRFNVKRTAVSEAVRQSVIRAYGERYTEGMRVITNPMNEFESTNLDRISQDVRAELDIPAKCLTIGTVASFRPVKRLDLLLKAYARIRPDMPNSILVLIGSGPELEQLRGLAEKLGIERFTRFTGHRSDPVRCSAALDVFVVCSDWEGLPLALLDAMAAGCAVIATRVGGMPEVITHASTGLLITPGSIEELEGAIRYLGGLPNERERLGSRAASYVRTHHHIDSVMSDYTAVYSTLLA